MADTPPRLDDLVDYVVSRHPDGDPLVNLEDAVETSVQLGELSDHLVGHFVDQARRSGSTWTEIGAHMGVSKQAAQKRFVPKDDDPDFPNRRGLSRFTTRARNALKQARTQAAELGDVEVGNEHLVLGLLSEPEGLAAKAMVECGVSLDQVRGTVLAVLHPSRKISPHRVRFTRSAKKSIELSLREALRMGHNYIGTEHLLLGLLRNDRDQAARLLDGLGITYDAVEAWFVKEIEAIEAARS